MNAMLATELLRWHGFVESQLGWVALARRIVDHLIDENTRRGVPALRGERQRVRGRPGGLLRVACAGALAGDGRYEIPDVRAREHRRVEGSLHCSDEGVQPDLLDGCAVGGGHPFGGQLALIRT